LRNSAKKGKEGPTQPSPRSSKTKIVEIGLHEAAEIIRHKTPKAKHFPRDSVTF